MFTSIPLYELDVGGSASVMSLAGDKNISKRFKELGIIEGTEIKKVLVSPLGDPAAYWVRGAVIAIRKADAGAITVSVNSIPAAGLTARLTVAENVVE